jgi:alpha-mannosidase
MILSRRHLFIFAAIMVASCSVPVATQPANDQKPVLYVVGTSHLDSQWNWTVQDTIREFVPNTFFQNFQRFEKYPNYTFNYEGAIHYMWFKEYHPEAWPMVQKYVAAGRFRVAGSWINAVDTNVPSPESLMRQALYGQRFFRQEFGKVSQDVYLPDCFGFSYALPAIATHCGLTQFSTQKLTWGSSYGIPFPLGRWKGSNGSTVVAALNPGDYVTKLRSDISTDPKWASERMTTVGDRRIGFRYFGTGDIGGAPDEESIDWLEKSIKNKAGVAEVRNTSSDQLTRDLTEPEKAALPEYEGELTMKTHGVGCYTSQAAMKRFNRENELLGTAAEQAAVAAELVAGLPYPRERMREAWIRMLWHQFHDDLTGTSIPQAYQFSWNDELVSANQFAGVLTSSVAAVAGKMDTSGEGIPLIVFNPLGWINEAPVEATVKFKGEAPPTILVFDPVFKIGVPTQILERNGDSARILFRGRIGPVGFKVFKVLPGTVAIPADLQVSDTSLENGAYKVQIDKNGDIASIFDKVTKRELLQAPIRLELRDDPSPDKPAWRILWDTVNAAPREYVTSPEIHVIERGPVRVAIEIIRYAGGSTFRQRVMLSARGRRVEVENFVDWKSTNSLLKVAFPFTASNPKATYDLGLGIIQRGNNTPDHYEVPAQQWADITDQSGQFGVAVLNNSKYGWDKPANNVLRLTLLHTPKARAYPYQSSNDLGQHHFTYSIAGHLGDWRLFDPSVDESSFIEHGSPHFKSVPGAPIPAQAAELNQPMIAFQTEAHAGPLGRTLWSMVSSNNNVDERVAIRALKKAEDSDEYVLRLQETEGRSSVKDLNLGLPLQSAREINAAEEPTPRAGDLRVSSNVLHISLRPFQPRTFALRFRQPNRIEPDLSTVGRAIVANTRITATPIELPFNLDGVSNDANRADGDFDGKGQTLAAELLPANLWLDGVPFKFGASADGALNVLAPSGQTLKLPAGNYNRVYVLAATIGGDVSSEISGQPLTIREWQGPVGQWDSRLKEPRQLREVSVAPMTPGQTWTADAINQDLVVQYDAATGVVKGIDQIRRGFVKREEIAWVGTHRHDPSGNQPYIGSYLFLYPIDLPAGTRELRLPDDNRIRIMAITLVREPFHLWPATPLYSSDLPTR